MKPLVSIIIPVYNAEAYLRETIASALAQTYPNKEIIIVNDGSTDSSINIAREFNSDIIKLIDQDKKGASAARNAGLRIAKGNYIQFLDADDLLSEDKISAQVHVLNGSPDHLAQCHTVYFRDTEDPYTATTTSEWYNTGSDDPVDFLTKLYAPADILPGYGGMIQPNAWLVPRSIITEAGYWNESLSVDDDGEFFCRIILASKGILYASEGINYYRQHIQHKSLSAFLLAKGYRSMLTATDIKYQYLSEKSNDKILVNKIFAAHYWRIGVNSFPQFISLSNQAIKKAKELGIKNKKYNGGPIAIYLSKIFGWRLLRILTYLRYKV